MSGHTGQARAALTRGRLVRNAATEFALHGYDGTALSRVCKAAGVTMGALTFHYPSKASLAQAVCAAGIEATRAVVDKADRQGKTPLQSVGGVVRALAALLIDESAARAAARLSRERPSLRMDWRDSWLPLVRTRLHQAEVLDQLRPGTRPESAALLVASLVAGVEAGLLPPPRRTLLPPPTAQEHLTELWQTALQGIGALQDDPASAP
ncbi:TetR/AcrR family transcriptional regulator [Streptomyces sp. NBC_01235]|uniref:TetR/AcrR family transcriptional regulator n=1 Tax=Streptomyces sp. NBC_01235 TaxID=2903788 RepID=UPI002E16498B|nr:TetR/AcrR family transcriptional regulator [Streptomyces sp. NBC_01235]